MSSYTVLAASVAHSLTEKNSEFLTFLQPVTDREQAMQWVQHYRERYKDAAHVCWAYIIGNTRQPQTQAFSDDGEPNGTAGKPMLHVLTERELGNSLAVVVRYFGGIKLGAGGLVRAYSAAVSQASQLATLVTLSPKVQLSINTDFAFEARIRQLLAQYGGELLSADYQQTVLLKLLLPAESSDTFTQQLQNISAGAIQITAPENTA
ncbi:YigZ family protein [Alishewanella longhuensis]|uniref:YigZ family protein n=1 Tax=Alishewanella longhuensis TaxID=1091037 RepID=A0ABQ3KV74_9ALTE|nr:YigZ family protein [Alishewanella longhuensis]GHG60244.1 YigZ family protein [Alishewanella longhuensis]